MTPPARFLSRSVDPCRVGLLLAITLGASFCVVRYIHRPSLWIDEAMLAVNIGARSFPELVRPLDLAQVAPVGFLWIERAATMLGGMNEWALRALPLLCACLLPFGFHRMSRRVVGEAAAVAGAAALAVSPLIVHFANEVKPYVSDALVGLVLLALALPLVTSRTTPGPSPDRGGAALGVLLVAGAVAPWISFPAVFTLASILAALAVERVQRGANSGLSLLALAVTWGASGAAAVRIAREPAISAFMAAFWRDAFLSLDRKGAANLAGHAILLPRLAVLGLEQPGGRAEYIATALACALVLTGAVALMRRRLALGTLACGPMAAGAGAALLHQYPLADRLHLYAVPSVLLLACAGLAWGTHRLMPGRPLAPLGLMGVLLLPALRTSFYDSHTPTFPGFREHARPIVAQVLENLHPDDALYVFPRATPAWLFYTADWRTERPALLGIIQLASPPRGPAFLNAATRGRPTPAEDSILTRHVAGRVEVLGVSSGLYLDAERRERVDALWAPGEVRRIRETGRPCVMLFFSSGMRGELSAMQEALVGAGARPGWGVEGLRSSARRFCLPRSP